MSPMVQTTKLFSEMQGGESQRPMEGEAKPKDNTTQPTQNTSKEGEVTLYHHEGPQSEICAGRIGKGSRVCVRHCVMCRYQHSININVKAGYYVKVPVDGSLEKSNHTRHRERALK